MSATYLACLLADLQLLSSRELKAEARRIIYHDHLVRVTSPEIDHSSIDFSAIDSEVTAQLKYLRSAKHAIRAALGFREQAGVYVSDGIVPRSLQHEVSI